VGWCEARTARWRARPARRRGGAGSSERWSRRGRRTLARETSARRGERAHGARDEERTRDEAMMEVMTRMRHFGEDEGRAARHACRPSSGQRDKAHPYVWSQGRSARERCCR
jgi:hypothetical protein